MEYNEVKIPGYNSSQASTHAGSLQRVWILHMKNGKTVNEYIARTLVVANKMKANYEDKGDVVAVEKILRSMNPKFNYIVYSIEESTDTNKLTIDEL